MTEQVGDQHVWPDRVWDVVVVGAGPAGSSAARVAAAAGASVLLLDRAEFPRYKTCAGGLVGASLAHLPESVLAVIEDRPSRAVFSRGGRAPIAITAPVPFLGMVQRERFDAALVEAAVDAGAEFRGGVTVHEVRQTDALAELDVADGTVRARTVIGADGSASRIARYVGVRYRVSDLGLEDEVPLDPSRLETQGWRGSILIDWGRHPGSYAWMFPKESSATIGVIQNVGRPDETRAFLSEWRQRLGLGDLDTSHSSGHLTRWRERDSPLRRGRVIVVGDAAGLLEPWLREGISFALRSGIFAGEAAAAGDLEAYVRRVNAVLVPEQRSGALLLAAFRRAPGLVHRAFATRFVQHFFVRYGRAEITLASFWRFRWVMRIAELVLRP